MKMFTVKKNIIFIFIFTFTLYTTIWIYGHSCREEELASTVKPKIEKQDTFSQQTFVDLRKGIVHDNVFKTKKQKATLPQKPPVDVEKAIMDETLLKEAIAAIKEHTETFPQTEYEPLLVLITTFQPNQEQFFIHQNLIESWGRLYPVVQPVFYYDTTIDSKMENLLNKYHWMIKPVPKLYHNLPVLSHMVLDAIDSIAGLYFGYANGDILFDESLILTLWSLYQNSSITDFLLTGRRTNVKIHEIKAVAGNLDLRSIASKESAQLFIREAMDYFVFSKHAFPWNGMLELVVAKRGIDNYIMHEAIVHYQLAIDATNSILCVHQSQDNTSEKASHKGTDADININMFPPQYGWYLGRTDCALWETVFDFDIRGVLLRRRGPKGCPKEHKQYGTA